MNYSVILNGNTLLSTADQSAAWTVYEAIADRLGMAEECTFDDDNGPLNGRTRDLHGECVDHDYTA